MHTHETNGKKIIWTIILNLIITIAEYFGGIYSGSLALLSDAGHNLSDVISLILSGLGEKISERKSTKSHSFGFKRVEIFTALINALSLLAIGIFIIIEALKRKGGEESISLGIMLCVAFIGLFGNAFSMMILNKNKDTNLNMKAAYMHLFYDAVSSVAVIASAIIIYFTHWYLLDILVSVFIALMIFWSGFWIIKSALHIFMQGVPEGIDFEEVYKEILDVKGVKSVHSIHIWSINSEEAFLSCHICSEEKTADTDETIKDVNDMLEKKFRIMHTTIQVERKNICGSGQMCCK
jgi:cobalt-zinc-cadmium efflux system protein